MGSFINSSNTLIALANGETSDAYKKEDDDADNEDNDEDDDEEKTSYDKILFNKDILSYQKNENITLEDTDNELEIKANSNDLNNTLFEFKNEFNFDKDDVSRIMLYGANLCDEEITIDFYIDDKENIFQKVDLLKTDENDKILDITQDISDKKLKGTHKIYFKINGNSNNKDLFLKLKSVQFIQSSIPVAYFNIDEEKGSIKDMNNDPKHNTKCQGDMTIQVPNSYTCEYTDKKEETSTYKLEYMRGRGGSTWENLGRKPYKIKLDKKADLFGMGANKHWILLANAYDNSLVRNKATYWLGEQLGLKYTPKSVYIDVVVNGEYYGNYLLCEQVRVDKNRVDIDDLSKTPDATDEDTISGGYLLSFYDDRKDAISFKTKRHTFQIESPDMSEQQNEAQYNYIKDYMQRVEDALYSENFTNDKGEHYSDLIDVDSFVDYYWIQEFSRNDDAFRTDSTYMYKERNGKLYFGPLWDFDYVAWGNHNKEYTELSTTRFNWYTQLFRDPTFVDKIKKRWPKFKEMLTKLCEDDGIIDNYNKQLEVSQKICFDKFGNSISAYNNNDIFFSDNSTSNLLDQQFWDELDYFLIKCDPTLFEIDDTFVNEFEDDISDELEKNDEKLSAEDNKVLSDMKDNPNSAQIILTSYVGFVKHKKAVIFLKTWIKCRCEWIDDNFDLLDKYNKTSPYYLKDTIQLTFDPDNNEDIITETFIPNQLNQSDIIPKNPTKEGMVFLGWYDPNGYKLDIPYKSEISFTKDITFTAKYIDKKDYIPIEKIEVENDTLYTYYNEKYGSHSFYIKGKAYPENATFANDLKVDILSDKDNIRHITSWYNDSCFIDYNKAKDIHLKLSDRYGDTSTTICIKPSTDENYKCKDMTSDKTEIEVKKDSITPMPINFLPEGNILFDKEWFSTNKNVAYVDPLNKLHAISEGEVEIRCYNYDIKKYISYKVKVVD